MRGSQELKSPDTAGGMRFLQRNGLPGSGAASDDDTGSSQLLSFPQSQAARPSIQPVDETAPRAYPTLAANDVAPPARGGRYNWDKRSAAQPALERPGRSPLRRWLLSAAALIVVAGVAVGGFLVMGHFADQKSITTAQAVTPVKADATHAPSKIAAATQPRSVKHEQAAETAPKAAATLAVPAIPVKTFAVAGGGSANQANVHVPAPDNARWGELADAGPKVDDPKSAPVPSTAPKEATPKELAYASPAPSADTSIEKEVAAPRLVDKSVTASLPKAQEPKEIAPKEAAPPGVDKSYLPGAGEASAAEEPVSGHREMVRTAVKMHAGPENGSRAIGVVPAKTAVEVLSCSAWCKISYNGKQGWVYKSFVGHVTSAAKPAASAAKADATAVASSATPQATAAPAAGLPTAPAGSPTAAEALSQMRR